jgi:UPF0755 protein
MSAMAKRLLIALAVLGVLLAAAALTANHFWRSLHEPLSIAEEGEWLDVPSGTPLRRISTELGERGILKYPWLLTWYGRFNGAATQIRAGEYRVPSGTTPATLLDQLTSGAVYLHQFTIVEGWRFTDMLAALRAHPAIVATELDGEAIMAQLGAPGVHPEGQFFPDTYRFPRGTLDVDLLRTAHAALQARLQQAWEMRDPDIAITTPYEALILASIIEKETALASERPLISGVFHERLKRQMRLQTDPTVIYGLGEAFDGNLRRQDLNRDTPYNTYTRAGLPPTPIALAGAAALEAAVRPEMSGALFFVATGLPDGSHYFSRTLEEHERAVAAYLERLRSR